MTINKISRSGSSVVTLAELKSGSAIFVQKVGRVSTAGPVITGGLVSQADIIKRGVQVQTIVGRALANPYGSVFNFFDRLGLSDEAILLLARQVALADQFFITHNTPKFLLNKGLSDSEPILERISLRIAAFRVFEDAQFVSTATKFTLTRPLADSQSLLDFARISAGYQRAAADIQTMVDTRRSIGIGKGNQDAVTQSDSIVKRATALKQDQTITTEAKALLPGKALFDGVTVRNHDDPGPALFVTKLLRDATTILDLTGIFDGLTYQNIMYRFDAVTASDNFSRTIAANRRFNESQSIVEKIFLQRGVIYQDTSIPADNKQLSITLVRADDAVVTEALQRVFLAQRVFQDAQIISEVKLLTAGIGKNDVATMLERLANAVGKVNADAAIVTERIGKSSIKALIDSIISTEAIAKLINKGLTDEVTIIEDILILLINFIRINADSVDTLNSQPIFSVGKRLTDTTISLEQSFRLIGKAAQDILVMSDRQPLFTVAKYLADIASMSDLAAAFDGITYNYGLGRLDETQAIDEFIRQITAFRTLEEQVSITDVFAKARGIGFTARSDTFALLDSIIIGKLPVDTLFIGSGQNQRSRNEERIRYTITKRIDTNFITQIDDINFFAGVQENLIGIVAGQTFAGSIMFASTSAGASVQVTSTGTGAGTAGGFATVYGNPYISFNGAGNRTVATVPIDFTAITSVSINFTYIAGNNGNGGEQPDLNEDLVIEYSTDDGATFVTAATIAAISTYGSPSWTQYTSSLPAAAKTSSTILRWRQTKQSISTGDNWGITNIQLGGTSFGTFVRTYYDNNTASIVDRLILGRFQRVGPDFVSFWQPSVNISSNLTYYALTLPITSTFGTSFNVQDMVQSQYSGRWIATQNQLNSPSRYFWSANGYNWTSANTVTIYPNRYLAADASGVAVVMTGTVYEPYLTTEYSADGGVSWNQSVVPFSTPPAAVPAPTSQGGYKPVYLANAATPSFLYPYCVTSANGVCIFLFTSGNSTGVVGARWNRGAAFPGIFEGGVNGTSNTLKIRGIANGSGTTVVYLTNYFNFGALYTLNDATTLNLSAAFTLTTSLSANRALFSSGAGTWDFNNHQQQLAFGNGRFVWIATNGNLLTTTSPTVSASWQSFSLQPLTASFTTGSVTYGSYAGAIHQHIVFDQVEKQFIIYRYGTSLTTAGFWTSKTGDTTDWTFRSLSSVGYTLDTTYPASPSSQFFGFTKQQLLFPSRVATYSTGNTSIGRLIIANGNEGYGFWSTSYPLVIGSLGAYVEPTSPLPPDRVTFGYGRLAKQGVNRTFSSQTTTAYDTERLYIGSQAAFTSAFVGYTSVYTGTTSFNRVGNLMLWSENLETSLYTSLGSAYIEVVPDQDFAPDGTWTADKVIVKSVGNASLTQSVLGRLTTSSTYTFSFAARAEDGSSSVGKRISFEHFDNYWGINFSTSIVLTQFWTRYSATFTTQSVAPSVSRVSLYFSNGGNELVTSAEVLTQNEYVYLWGLSIVGPSGGDNQRRYGYTRTTSTTIVAPGGTQTIDNYTTSNLYSSSIGWRYPLYFVGTLVSSTPVAIYTTSVGAYAFQTPIRTWDDTQEKVSFLIGQNPKEVLSADETTRLLLTGARRFDETANIADNKALSITMPAYRGVAGQVQLKTINAAGNQAQSSVLFSYGSRSPDVVGTIDLIFVAIIKTATVADSISIGSGIDQRQFNTERISFAITKVNTDTIAIDERPITVFTKVNRDTAIVAERPVFSIALNKTEVLTASDVVTTTRGKGLVEIITVIDRVAQRISLLKADEQSIADNRVFAVSLTKADAVTASQTLIALNSSKPLSDISGVDDQQFKAVTKVNTELLDTGADRTNFDVALTAYRGVAGTVTLNTIDPNPDVEFEQSSVTVVRGARSPDEVGMLDLFSLLYIINRQLEDAVTAADQRTFFTITKTFADSFAPDDFLATFDGLTYAGFMLRQDYIDAAQRVFMDVVLGTRTEFIGIADRAALVYNKPVADNIAIADATRNSIALLKTESQLILDVNKFDISKSLQDSATVVDILSLLNASSRSVQDSISASDRSVLSITKYNADNIDTNDVLSLIAINNKFFFELVNNQDATQFAISQFTNNTVASLDQLAFAQSKLLADSFIETDVSRFDVSLVKADAQTLDDQRSLAISLVKSDVVTLADLASLVGSFSRSVFDDLAIVQGPVFFTITKTFADSFVPDDFLRTFDGLTYAYATSRYDEIATAQRVFMDVVLGTRADTVVSLEQILVAQLKRYEDTTTETDQLRLRVSNLINNVAIAVDVQQFSIAAVKADSLAGDERKYLDVRKLVSPDTISLADLIDLILFIPTPDQFYFDSIAISDASFLSVSKRLREAVTVDDNKALDVAIVAHRGVAGTVTLNTIDSSPDIEFEQSSVTVSRSSMDRDEVGTLDFFSLTYSTVRSIEDFIAIADVAPKFAITKLLRDAAVPDDFLQTFDGLTYATTILKQDSVSIGLPGFTGRRVSGDDRERIAIDVAVTKSDAVSSIDTRLTIISGKGNSDVVQNSDALVLRVSILKTDVQIVADTQRFFDIATSRSDSTINQDALRRDISKLLGSTEIISIADLLALQAQYRLSLAEIQNILGEKDGNFRYLLAQPKNDALSTSGDRLSSFISKDLTNLDGLNNINTMVSNGTLRMTDYADIDYFAEDYVGQSRSFT